MVGLGCSKEGKIKTNAPKTGKFLHDMSLSGKHPVASNANTHTHTTTKLEIFRQTAQQRLDLESDMMYNGID